LKNYWEFNKGIDNVVQLFENLNNYWFQSFLNFNIKKLSNLVFLKKIIIREPLVMAISKTLKNQQFS
jgi:hypothetical protein